MRGFFFALKNNLTYADTMHSLPINLFHKPKGLRQDNPTLIFLILSFMLFTKEKNGAEYVIDYVEDKKESYWFSDDDYNEWTEDFVVQIPYGFLLMPKDYNSKDVVVDSDGNLFIGRKIVYDYIDVCKRHSDMKGRIPAYYCIRTEQGSDERPFLGFECGFDLHLTQFWANGNYFDTIKECFSFLQSKYGDFVITLEESMRMD